MKKHSSNNNQKNGKSHPFLKEYGSNERTYLKPKQGTNFPKSKKRKK